MLKLNVFTFFLILSTSFLSACSTPKTPQQVTQVFWQSVLDGKTEEIVKYSTLTDSKQYDHFSKSWENYRPSLGKIVIEGENARIETNFTASADTKDEKRLFTTHLVQRDGNWLVDYARTKEEIQGGVIGNLLGKLGQAGKQLSSQLDETAGNLDIKLKRMGDELEALAKSLDEKTKSSVNKLSDELRKNLLDLEQSIQRALQDKDRNWSEHDRSVLNEVSKDLQNDKNRLANSNVDAIAVSSRNVGEIQQRLSSIDEQISGELKKQWLELSQDFEKNLQEIIDELAEDD